MFETKPQGKWVLRLFHSLASHKPTIQPDSCNKGAALDFRVIEAPGKGRPLNMWNDIVTLTFAAIKS